MDGIHTLKRFLGAQPPGPIEDTNQLVQLLSSCWDEFPGSSESKMRSDKLWRIEDPVWNPPILLFWIERHGQTVMGSKRASLHQWSVDPENPSAEIVREKKRQLRPNDKRLDVKAIAETLADAIINGGSDEWFTIRSDGRVKIEIGHAIPETSAQTTAARRKRFRRELTAPVKPHGWEELRANLYARSEGEQ